MAIDRLTPTMRRDKESKYKDQGLVFGDMARSFEFGATVLEAVHDDIGVVGNLLVKRGINDVLRDLDKFESDIKSCFSGAIDEENSYNPRDVLGMLVPQDEDQRESKLIAISDTYLTTKGTLLLVKHGVMIPNRYLQQGSGFLLLLKGMYESQSKKSFKMANDVLWSTNPGINI